MVHFENSFPPPIPPPIPSGKGAQENTQHSGNKLFTATTEFYDWLMGTWLSNHADQTATFQRINQLLRIADCSHHQGHFLTPQDEDEALERLQTCREQLYNGEIRTQDIPATIANVVFTLTHGNPKALLVAKLTEIEYRFCIYPSQKKTHQDDQELRSLLQRAIGEITPRLLDIKALELARELSSFLETDQPPDELKQTLQTWLSSMLY